MTKKDFMLFGILFLGIFMIFQSCVTKRNLVYFSNLSDSTIYQQIIKNKPELKIQPGDALSIKVTTLNPQSNVLFNSGAISLEGLTGESVQSAGQSVTSLSSRSSSGYMVDGKGDILFPIFGRVHLAGLTLEEAQQKMIDLVSKTDKGVIVNMNILNYKVTVIGEVARPGSFTIPDDKVTVLEALGLAGDMTPYAVRENVLVIRESNGVRTMQRLNMNDKDVYKSPFFYLQQNDVVYVQPENKLKVAQTDTRLIRLLPIISVTISALTIILSRLL